MGRELLSFGSTVDLHPAQRVLEVGAAREELLHGGRAVDLAEAALREEDEPKAVEVAPREG